MLSKVKAWKRNHTWSAHRFLTSAIVKCMKTPAFNRLKFETFQDTVQGASVLTSASCQARLSWGSTPKIPLLVHHGITNVPMSIYVLDFPDTSPSFNALGMPPTPRLAIVFLCKKNDDFNPRLSSHHVQLRPPFDHQDSWETSGFAPGLPPSHRLERISTKRVVNTFQSRCQPPKTKWYYYTIPSIDQYIKSSYNKNKKMTQWISRAPYCSQHKFHPIRPEALTTR